jgi:hypothetical protein
MQIVFFVFNILTIHVYICNYTMTTKRALLIGINYLNTPSARLNGCIEDVKNIQNMLVDAYGYSPENIVVLRDDMPGRVPTKANILLAIQKIVAVSAATDEFWFHYSGHGTQLRDTNTDESDMLDEAIVPSDFQSAGMILDDDLFKLIQNIRCKAFFVFDSCHSGSVCDLQYSINYVSGSFTRTITSKKIIANPNIVLLSGCRDAQTSADSYDSSANIFGGALTMALTATLRKNRHSAEIGKIYNDVCYSLLTQKYSQIPVLSSSAMTPSFVFSRPPTERIASLTIPNTSGGVSPTTSSLVLPIKNPTSTTISMAPLLVPYSVVISQPVKHKNVSFAVKRARANKPLYFL